MKRSRVVVTGLGVVSSIGIGWRALWESLLAGRSGIREIRYIDTSDYPTKVGGEVTSFDPDLFIPKALVRRLGRGSQFAITAAKLALEDAGFPRPDFSKRRIGVCLGTTMADIQILESINETWIALDDKKIPSSLVTRYPSYSMSTNVAKYFGCTGPNLMIPTACAAGNYAIGFGTDLIRTGRADAVIAGGVDPFSRIAFMGFNRIFAVAPEKCQPFDKNRQGTVVGEGAGIVLLERLEDAKQRGATIYAEILGYGLSCDGTHMTIPESSGIERVMRKAMEDAGIERTDVDYISAHGTGTPANDRTECAAIRKVFGSHTDYLPVSSIKSMLGHTMGAASALEAIACVLAIRHKHIPPTINFETPDPECPIDCVPNVSREHKVRVALNNSFAFGGNNACVVFSKS